MTIKLWRLWVIIAILLVSGSPVSAQDSFFKGKIVRIIVGFTAGGGYDTYSRAIARHMGKHIPGGPTLVVENMPGAASLISANYTFKVAKPDGLTMAILSGDCFYNSSWENRGLSLTPASLSIWGFRHRTTTCAAYPKRLGLPAQSNG